MAFSTPKPAPHITQAPKSGKTNPTTPNPISGPWGALSTKCALKDLLSRLPVCKDSTKKLIKENFQESLTFIQTNCSI